MLSIKFAVNDALEVFKWNTEIKVLLSVVVVDGCAVIVALLEISFSVNESASCGTSPFPWKSLRECCSWPFPTTNQPESMVELRPATERCNAWKKRERENKIMIRLLHFQFNFYAIFILNIQIGVHFKYENYLPGAEHFKAIFMKRELKKKRTAAHRKWGRIDINVHCIFGKCMRNIKVHSTEMQTLNGPNEFYLMKLTTFHQHHQMHAILSSLRGGKK